MLAVSLMNEVERYATSRRSDLVRIVGKIVGNRQDAEDIAQEALLRAFKYYDDLTEERRAGRTIDAWIVMIARNCAIDAKRRCKSVIPSMSLDDDDWTSLAPRLEMSERFPTEECERIRGLIPTLPPLYRRVIVMRHYLDLEYSDIAKATGMPIGSVRSAIHRGRELLRDGLRLGAIPRRRRCKRRAA